MTTNNKTIKNIKSQSVLRLLYPQWQGGANPKYQVGARVLAHILPGAIEADYIKVPVGQNQPVDTWRVEDGVYEKETLLKQIEAAKTIIAAAEPEKIITVGGDCSVSQAPFDYLHGKYGAHTAILWFDAHPDIMKPTQFNHEHAMVLGNLLGDGEPDFAARVEHPFTPDQVLYVGLKAEDMLDFEGAYLKEHRMSYLRPQDLLDTSEDGKTIINSKPILDWLRERNVKQVLIHFDMDVLDANDFRGLLYNEPGLGPVSYATGSMTLDQITTHFVEIGNVADIVGLSFAEYMPWDIIRLQEKMSHVKIFNE